MQDDNKKAEQQTKSNQSQNYEQRASDKPLIQPQDISKTVESAVHVLQGRTDKLPDLMKHSSNILVKASERMSTTQLIIAVGALAIGALWMAKKANEND